MKADTAATRAPGVSALQARIEAYNRYAELVYEQIQVLDREDLDAFAALARQREALAQRIDAAAASGPGAGAGDASPETVAAAREALARCVEADVRLLERLRALRHEARDGLRNLDARRARIEAYLAADRGPASVDVRS